MRILIQKFGGTSLSNEQARECVIQHIAREREASYATVVVVSAMGRRGLPYATDTFIQYIRDNGDSLPPRELDLLLGCGEIISAAVLCSLLRKHGISASVLTGAGAGIYTDDQHGSARIKRIQPDRILKLLQEGEVVIVTGFQGVNSLGDLTTLGRGGSDTTATALGAALGAEMVDIYTDVDGILTADPKYVNEAKPLPSVSYAEICNMARQGAKVIHPRAVEIAQQSRIPVRVRSTFASGTGTLVSDQTGIHAAFVSDRHVTGIAQVSGVTQIAVEALDNRNDMQLQVFRTMAKHGISVDFINVTPNGALYTVFDEQAAKAVELLADAGFHPKSIPGCAKISVIGGGMNGQPGVMAQIVEALTEQGITIMQSADSNTTIWVLVREADMAKALRALHAKFDLHR
ncbi:aspartate kinase [Paenibacillus sp. J5C_2022]|uniref:aspartate kinase n=1 Tax=Paenibacillus sp. J5C2022 TaxID=2977129 RepID=UPI0021D324C0|nr:aspartate kinase [Paenibacillus sp. J5C2022]MCU6707159.1 aspartate kinase [Paenibacillus sp. J5C2022]